MNAIMQPLGDMPGSHMVDDVYHYNVLCCLDECDRRCSLIHRCWLSPWTKKPGEQLELPFAEYATSDND